MLEFTDSLILTPGIHESDMEEIEQFLGSSISFQRALLYNKLNEYVQQLRTAKIAVALILDGSFVMPCVKNPGDIDIVLVMPENWDRVIEQIPPEHYNLLSSGRLKQKFGFDVFVVAEHSPELQNWIRFFANIKGDWHFTFDISYDTFKGLIRVQ